MTGATVNQICNDPRVDQGPIDLEPLVRHGSAIALVGVPPYGTHILMPVVQGVYEFHSACLPAGRGEWMADFTEECIHYMFCATDCIELITCIPQANLAALSLSRKFGFQPRWACVRQYKGVVMPHAIVSLTMFEWLPPERDGFDLFIDEMRKAQAVKAATWAQRRRVVEREVN